MQLPKNNFKVNSYSDGEGDGYWEIVNDKGDGLRTTEDFEDVEMGLKKIVRAINAFPGKFTVQTSLELTLHCNEQMAKMECDHWKQQAGNLLAILESIKEDCKSKGIPMDLVLQSIYNKAEKAVKGYYGTEK